MAIVDRICHLSGFGDVYQPSHAALYHAPRCRSQFCLCINRQAVLREGTDLVGHGETRGGIVRLDSSSEVTRPASSTSRSSSMT
jgi:hypothetical protein